MLPLLYVLTTDSFFCRTEDWVLFLINILFYTRGIILLISAHYPIDELDLFGARGNFYVSKLQIGVILIQFDAIFCKNLVLFKLHAHLSATLITPCVYLEIFVLLVQAAQKHSGMLDGQCSAASAGTTTTKDLHAVLPQLQLQKVITKVIVLPLPFCYSSYSGWILISAFVISWIYDVLLWLLFALLSF